MSGSVDSESSIPKHATKPSRRLGIFPRRAAEPATEEVKKDQFPPVSFTELFRFSTKFDLVIDAIGLCAACAAGAAQPLMSLLLGNLTQAFVNFGVVLNTPGGPTREAVTAAADNFRTAAAHSALLLLCLGLGIFVCTYVYMVIWTHTGEVNAKRVPEAYLKAVLRQDIAFFDTLGAGEVTTRIQTDCHLVQQGISEKVALTANFLGAFFTGFILAFARSWRLALALSSMLPCLAITGAVMGKIIGGYVKKSLQHVAEGGTLAEEVISTIRTAKAFGTQLTLGALYNEHVMKANVYDVKQALVQGSGIGTFWFVIYSGYALGELRLSFNAPRRVGHRLGGGTRYRTRVVRLCGKS